MVFTFEQKNHSATQSSFNRPCTPKRGGFDSGLLVLSVFLRSRFVLSYFISSHPVPPGQTSGFPTFTVPVTTEVSNPML